MGYREVKTFEGISGEEQVDFMLLRGSAFSQFMYH
jgi:hypothetical protein